jgi:hypothetical protein
LAHDAAAGPRGHSRDQRAMAEISEPLHTDTVTETDRGPHRGR